MRRGLRRLCFGLATLFGRPRGFFIPYRYASGVRPLAYPALEPIFAAAEAEMAAVLDWIEAFGPDLARIAEGAGPARFDQDWFSGLDAAVAYALIRHQKPRRIVEIGSGHSTRFLSAAVRDGSLETEIICIDPAPRAPLTGLAVRHERCLLAEADPAIPAELQSGDVLFVDSSHIAMPGTDVDRLVLDLLPRLPPGVLVHLHDVFLPDAYPAEWAWRGYNEQIVVGALIQGGGYEIAFASHWARTRLSDRLRSGFVSELQVRPDAFESSLWLRKKSGPAR